MHILATILAVFIIASIVMSFAIPLSHALAMSPWYRNKFNITDEALRLLPDGYSLTTEILPHTLRVKISSTNDVHYTYTKFYWLPYFLRKTGPNFINTCVKTFITKYPVKTITPPVDIKPTKPNTNTDELVLAISRGELGSKAFLTGVFDIDLTAIDQQAYAFLPRKIADNKSSSSITAGEVFPQILGYVQVQNEHGQYLSYARKGKEEGLHGLRSIGIGGHVSHNELITAAYRSDNPEQLPTIVELIKLGLVREIEEELNITIQEDINLSSMVVSEANDTSKVHVGLIATITLGSSAIEFDPAEFLDVQWLTKDELANTVDLYEPWSKEIIYAL